MRESKEESNDDDQHRAQNRPNVVETFTFDGLVQRWHADNRTQVGSDLTGIARQRSMRRHFEQHVARIITAGGHDADLEFYRWCHTQIILEAEEKVREHKDENRPGQDHNNLQQDPDPSAPEQDHNNPQQDPDPAPAAPENGIHIYHPQEQGVVEIPGYHRRNVMAQLLGERTERTVNE